LVFGLFLGPTVAFPRFSFARVRVFPPPGVPALSRMTCLFFKTNKLSINHALGKKPHFSVAALRRPVADLVAA
jgi:hypothetical protein